MSKFQPDFGLSLSQLLEEHEDAQESAEVLHELANLLFMDLPQDVQLFWELWAIKQLDARRREKRKELEKFRKGA